VVEFKYLETILTLLNKLRAEEQFELGECLPLLRPEYFVLPFAIQNLIKIHGAILFASPYAIGYDMPLK
jgi:hypothetical protein